MRFQPTETPDGIPVNHTFEIRNGAYVVDVYGTVYRILTHADDPENWVWTEVINL